MHDTNPPKSRPAPQISGENTAALSPIGIVTVSLDAEFNTCPSLVGEVVPEQTLPISRFTSWMGGMKPALKPGLLSEHVMDCYMIWKFADNKEGAQKFQKGPVASWTV